MERLTYVTENGTVMFSPDGKDAATIIDISEMGDTEYLEQIADTLANREGAAMFYERKYKEKCKELKAYEDTGLTPQEITDGKLLTGWIPVEEKLPEEPSAGLTEMEDPQEYIVMIDGAELPTVLSYAGNGEWYWDGDFYRVLAWMPLPEPYRPGAGPAETEGTDGSS